MKTDLATNGRQADSLATPNDVGGYMPMQPLDVYAGGLSDEAPRVDALATISCGRLVGEGDGARPAAARKSDPAWIYIHDQNDRAPGLTQALQAGNSRRLVIAFPYDDPRQFVMQRFAEYSKSALKAYGDERQITEIIPQGDTGEHRTYQAGTAEYDRIVARCKTSVSVYFALAEWAQDGPRVTFPDGLGLYRLRFTSRNTLRNLLATLDQTAKMTNGRIAGIPFDLGVDFREVAAPNGKKRSIPVFTFVMAPPGGITSRTFRQVTGTALSQGEALRMLPAPSRETLEMATLDGPVGDDVTDEDVDRLNRGGRCDRRYYIKLWHSVVRGTSLADAEARHEFIGDHADGIRSLSWFMSEASESEAAGLIAAAQDYLMERGEIVQDADDDDPAPSSPTTYGGDEYERTYGAAYQEETAPAVRQQTPDERPAYAEGNATARRAADALREVIDQAVAVAPAESIDEPVGATTADDPAEREKKLATYRALQVQGKRYGVTVPDPDDGATAAEIEERGKHFKGLVLEAKSNHDNQPAATPV